MSAITTATDLRHCEEEAFRSGKANPEALMEQAGLGVARVVRQFHRQPGDCMIFCGKGSNAADALIAGRRLLEAGWRIFVECAFHPDDMSAVANQHLQALQQAEVAIFDETALRGPLVVLDGLLGLGSHGEPLEPVAGRIEEINRLRQERGARVFAVDLPSGLDPETGHPASRCVQADVTVTFGATKQGLLEDAATNFVGRLAVVPLKELNPTPLPDKQVATPDLLAPWLPPRSFDTHKGRYGRLLIVAGSIGYFGAARLCALGALHGGAGLITLLARPQVYPYHMLGIADEIMVRPMEDYREVIREEFDAAIVGPGLNSTEIPELVELLRNLPCPTVVDAGALDALATNLKMLRLATAPRVLTPHPGEMARLTRSKEQDRAKIVRSFIEETPCVLLLKGARTLVGAPGRPLVYNTTGTPGMATGGMGDVLSGVIGALLAQGLRPTQAASIGAWVCGRAAEEALATCESEQTLSATHIPHYLGRAFEALRRSGF